MATQGKALITGASAGIGAIYADRLAKRGYDLIVVARNSERLKAALGRISGDTNDSVEIIAADLANPADLRRLEETIRGDAAIELLVNNAGTAMTGNLAISEADALERMIRLNVVAPTRLAAAVIPGFVARRRGTLINVSSAVALAPEWINGVYSGTKAYLLNFSLRLQREVAGDGVRIQVVLPGAIRTGMWEKAGTSISAFAPEIVMNAGALVDAALAGLDAGEQVTIPSLPDVSDWHAYEAARRHMIPMLSRDTPAPRYTAAGPHV